MFYVLHVFCSHVRSSLVKLATLLYYRAVYNTTILVAKKCTGRYNFRPVQFLRDTRHMHACTILNGTTGKNSV